MRDFAFKLCILFFTKIYAYQRGYSKIYSRDHVIRSSCENRFSARAARDNRLLEIFEWNKKVYCSLNGGKKSLLSKKSLERPA